ncbi:MAG: hypothetical protein CVU42_15420 [Chloroflexi bacterium HGW-Chloroflexi-4]|jgi:hypothetical protein|nr:MAG: hypothetical protein CVU42_15420 [Chloroflexi bacterium HGW-Chloroflexi-4]
MKEKTKPTIYTIKLKGRLSREWSEWLEAMTIEYEGENETIVKGDILDQSALFGLLKKIRDLGLPLISINQISNKPNQERK